MRKHIKTIISFIIFIIETFVTVLSLKNDWDSIIPNISSALLFSTILILYKSLQSILDKFDSEHIDMMTHITQEHNEIKGLIDLNKDVVELSTLALYEANYVYTQSGKDEDVEIWIISNDVAECDQIIDKMYHNIELGVDYYYVIPKDALCVNDLKKTVKKLRKKSKKDKDKTMLRYIQDDIFDMLPSNYIDFVFYCNPSSTDYDSNMKAFYCLQKTSSGVFYKPAELSDHDIHGYLETMKQWKKKQWNELY